MPSSKSCSKAPYLPLAPCLTPAYSHPNHTHYSHPPITHPVVHVGERREHVAHELARVVLAQREPRLGAEVRVRVALALRLGECVFVRFECVCEDERGEGG